MYQASKLKVAKAKFAQESDGGRKGKQAKFAEWADFCVGKTGDTVPRSTKDLHYKTVATTIGAGKEAWPDTGVTNARLLRFVQEIVVIKQTKVAVAGAKPAIYTNTAISAKTVGVYITAMKGLHEMQMLDPSKYDRKQPLPAAATSSH